VREEAGVGVLLKAGDMARVEVALLKDVLDVLKLGVLKAVCVLSGVYVRLSDGDNV